RVPGLLPDLTTSEALEVSAIHSLAGFALSDGLITRPPFADPHHSASTPSIIGGGQRIAKPGAISCAHRGVLFLDEAPEFAAVVLEALRTPLESGLITISRSEFETRYPARFQLIMAANPCPCGLAATSGAQCRCAPAQIRRYANKISMPIRDRIDIVQAFLPLGKTLLKVAAKHPSEASAVVAGRVAQARARQASRLAGTPWLTNGEVPGCHLTKQLPLPDGLHLLDEAVNRGRLSARGVDKVLRISWTLADLGGRDRPSDGDLAVALAMRRGESLVTADHGIV
ncbi:MAG TPA: ATP-binding protein, partial [Propionibacteriaceae bacterium]|nr:ATP-binding protein [Propionibacteriaceae bacterium]